MKQSMKLAARILENLPAMSPDIMQGWIENPKALQKLLAQLVPTDKESTVELKRGNNTRYLRFLQSAVIGASSGKITIAKAKDVFTGHLNQDFSSMGTDLPNIDTQETPVDIYEMRRSGRLRTLFGSFGVDERFLCLTQGQIKEFCRTNPGMLRQNGYATLFLFKVNEELFVARVYEGAGHLKIHLEFFSDDEVWSADQRPRLVVPQLSV